MTLKTSDALFGAPRLPAAAFKAWAKARGAHAGYDVWTDEIARVCAAVGLDDAVVAFQGAWETGQFTSRYFDLGNTGGIGISADGVPSPFTTKDYRLAARIHVANLLTLLGKPLPPAVQDATSVPAVAAFLKRVAAAAADPKRPPMRTLADMCRPYTDSRGERQCTYACDDNYAAGICQRANASGVNVPDQGTTPAPRPAPGAGPAATTLARVNLRDAPWGTVVGTLDAGAAVTITGPAARGWWPVAANGQSGYVAASLVTAGSRTAVAGVFGQITGGQGRISQSFGNVPVPNPCGAGCYDYVTEYLMEPGAHGGIDVGLPIGTPLFLPVAGRCVCAGTGRGTEGCAAFGSDDGGSGRVEFDLGGGVRLVLGHTHRSYVTAGKDYAAGAHVADSGTAGTGGHVHVELRFPADNTGSGSIMGDPSLYFGLGASPAPRPQPQPRPGPDLAAAFGSAVFNGTTYKYDPAGVISGLWRARGDQTGAYPALLAVAERGPARYFVFANGAVAFTPADGAPAQWLGAAS